MKNIKSMKPYDIPPYLAFLPPRLLEALDARHVDVPEVPGLRVASGLREAFPSILTGEALSFTCELYRRTRGRLARVLDQRRRDRDFIDRTTEALVTDNQGIGYRSPEYQTVIGRKDGDGRVVVGPLEETAASSGGASADPWPLVDIPKPFQGEQITLFGPPDSRKLSINAMNAWHRRLPDEPPIVAELVDESGQIPRWGADDEDSKTPIMQDFLHACENLIGCFEQTLTFTDPRTGRAYRIADDHRALPIKRVPGLALPDGHHLLDGNPLPLHLLDFALHLYHNRDKPHALVFYFPKLENEEEAAYVHALIAEADALLHALHPDYVPGGVRMIVVFENPRAIFRIREIARALHPYFLGGSLGWHDFLASTARLFRRDPRYRIPVKADPNIVVNNIRESHVLLAEALGPLGALKIGGMYGVLYEEGNRRSFEVSMAGYIRDVVTQLRRGLDGFWVAHPSFVRTGIAITQAFRRRQRDPNDDALERLIRSLIRDPDEQARILNFVDGPDVPGLRRDDPLYLRGVLAADVQTSTVIANDHPDEIRYNIFQALQYLADWLSGRGCVALPATMPTAAGDPVFVRIMDDLATMERSRWELWAEVNHGRVSKDAFSAMLDDELDAIRRGDEEGTRRIQVRWEGEAARWYPVGAHILRLLVLDPEPVEFASELLLPFTFPLIRNADDPLREAERWCPGRYTPPSTRS